MEFEETVRRRRMVRRYADRPVPREIIEGLLDIARRAPSAGFSQGQRFVAVTDPETRRAIAELADEPSYVERGFDAWISTAPVHVVLCADERAYRERYEQPDKADPGAGPSSWPVPYWQVDAGASLMLLLLAVVDAGLSAGFLGAHRLGGIAALLGIPDGVHVVGLVTVGYPAPDRRPASLLRGWHDLGEVVSWGGRGAGWTEPP